MDGGVVKGVCIFIAFFGPLCMVEKSSSSVYFLNKWISIREYHENHTGDSSQENMAQENNGKLQAISESEILEAITLEMIMFH